MKTGVTVLVLELRTATQQSIRNPALLHSFRFLSEDWGEFQNGMHMESIEKYNFREFCKILQWATRTIESFYFFDHHPFHFSFHI